MYVRTQAFCCCMAVSLLACRTPAATSKAGPAATAPPAPEVPVAAGAEKPIDVSLRVEAATAAGQSFIDSDEALRSGDRLALHVNVSEPAYVYVGLTAADGTRSLIFPQAGNELLAPGSVHRIPAAGHWFKLDRNAGQEDIFLYASRKPLANEQALALLKDDSIRARRAEPAAPGKPPPRKKPPTKKEPSTKKKPDPADDEPGEITVATRGLKEVSEEGDVQAGKDLTRAHFVIRHQK